MKKGFTLIELLVTVSIISLLASVVAISLTGAKAHANDAARKATIRTIQTAVTSYKSDHAGKAPVPVISGTATYGTTVRDNDGTSNFHDTMKALVDGGYMGGYPQSSLGIFYYATAAEGDDEVVIGATLENAVTSTTGETGTCRPFSNSATIEAPKVVPPYQACVIPTGPGWDGESGIKGCGNYDSNGQLVIQKYFNTECQNGGDDDGDGKIDYDEGFYYKPYQADPGCGSPDDDGESPDPSPIPAYCSNNVANTDYCICM